MMTVGIELKCSVSLHNLSKYLDISDFIVGIKYKHIDKVILKGSYDTSKNRGNTSLFNNQVSIAISYQGKRINIKVFKNGMLHITGVNSESQIIEVKDKFIDALNDLENKKYTCIMVSTKFPIVNSDGILFNSTGTRDIGHNHGKVPVESNIYIIDRRTFRYNPEHKIYIHMNNLYEKDILDLDGVLIGKQKLVNNTRYKRIYKNGKTIVETYHGVYLDDKLMGVFEYMWYPEKDNVNITELDSCVVNYPMYPLNRVINCNDYTTKDINYYNISVNYTYPSKFTRMELMRYLESNGFLINYDMGKSSKVNLSLKDNESNSGKCDCEYSCICKNVTIFIFETGKINVYGIKKLQSIDTIIGIVNSELDNFVKIEKRADTK